ncbi:FAD binding domain protein [Oesophagostomum dentatum]|uniref:NADPH--cytochrome P450 reductase n=1 Tax=Oesophagostomum dentatum TaxID=61180 RepID=A0A0B1T5X0_OESDE|nr:FAD binding domain protein [Oesophagostomum dentatum]
MWEWLASQLDIMDIIILATLMIGGLYFIVKYRLTSGPSRYAPNVTPITPMVKPKDMSFIARMKNENRQVLIMYGSQTGTAEELSGRLAKDFTRYAKKALVIDPEEIDVDDMARLSEIDGCLVVFCMATYGEGDPTDNAQQLYEYINTTDTDFKGVKYAVFGLGNKTYEHFNAVGKLFDKRLEELGAERAFPLGLGDDDANLEEDFMRWREAFLPTVAQQYGWELNTDAETLRQYRLELIDENANVTLFKGEYARLGAFERLRPPFDQKNPFPATIAENRELHTDKSERSCRHIEFAVEGSRIRYEAGDHLGVFPTNDPELIDAMISLLDFNPEQAFRLINIDEESSKRNPFPCPCTYRTALTHYVDICAPLKSHVLKAISEYCADEKEKTHLQLLSTANEEGLAISEYCTDEKEKAHLQLLSTANEEGLKEYSDYIVKERRSIIDVLRDHPTCKPPIEYLLELLPRLQARYYSIASSPKHQDNRIAICCIVTKYTIGDRLIKGVCTNYLLGKDVNDRTPVFVRKSQMRLPHRTTTPVIMVGPGTGFAPFRAFIQERKFQKDLGEFLLASPKIQIVFIDFFLGKEMGPMMLYYGCRHPEHDYIYRDEIEQWVSEGVITDLYCAFSRAQAHKIYVQDRLWESRDKVWGAVEAGAHIYVCGYVTFTCCYY